MSASSSRGLLTMATRQIMSQWGDTKNSWHDQKAAEFERAYLTEISQTVSTALRVLEELDHLLEKIHADCD